MNSPSILIVDDHQLAREGLRAVLEGDGYSVIALAETGEQAVELTARLEPDIVLMDLVMPGMDGATATAQILAELPNTRVIALTTFSDEELVNNAMGAGVISYMLKNANIDELARAIRDAYVGKPTVVPEALQSLIRSKKTPDLPPVHLTGRERDVLECLVLGRTNQQIADTLNVSLSTVKQHVSNILAKLGASSRTEAVATAMKRNLTV